MRRVLAIASAVVLILLVVAGLWFRQYLHSKDVLERVTSQIEQAYGGHVRIDKVDIGVKGTTLRDVALFEEGSDTAKDTPWLKIESITTDVSLMSLMSGDASAHHLTARGASLILRFDDAGNLLTRLPQAQEPRAETHLFDALPDTTFEQTEVVLRRAGQPDFTLRNVGVKIVKGQDSLTFTGAGEVPDIGKFTAKGSAERAFRKIDADLATDGDIHLTQAKLERIPFMPAELLRQVRVDQASGTAKLTAHYDTKEKDLRYRLETSPKDVRIHLSALSLTAHMAQGSLTVEDHFVHVRDMKGSAFGGSFRADADLDLRGVSSQHMSLKIDVADMNVKELPVSWNIPTIVRKTVPDGKLTGRASLDMTIEPRRMDAGDAAVLTSLTATGQWLDAATWVTVYPPQRLHFRSHGQGQVRDPNGKISPIDFDWHMTPDVSLRTLSPLHFISLLVDEPSQKAEQQPAAKGKENVEFRLDLKDARLSELVKNLELKLPFAVDGTASLHVNASFPADRLDDRKAYQAAGTIDIKDLTLSGMKFNELHADLLYAEGLLQLKTLRASVAKNAGADTLRGSGQIQVEPPGELKVDLQLNRLALESLTKSKNPPLQGTVSGQLSLRAPSDQLAKLEAFRADGKLTSERITTQGWTIEAISSTIKLVGGVLQLPDLKAEIGGMPIDAAAALRLTENNSFVGEVKLAPIELTALEKRLDPKNKPPVALRGAIAGAVTMQGKLDPFEINFTGDATAPEIQIEAFKAKDVRARWTTDGKTIDVTGFAASLYGGKATGAATLPLDAKAAGRLVVNVVDMETSQLSKDLHVPFRMEGHVNGTLKGTIPPRDQPSAVKLDLDLRASTLRVQNIRTEQLQGSVEYQNNLFEYKLKGKSLGGTFDLEGVAPGPGKEPKKDKAPEGRLRIRDVQLARLLKTQNIKASEKLGGTIHLDLQYTHKPGATIPEGKGSLTVTRVGLNEKVIAERLSGELVLANQQLRLRNFGGNLGEGTAQAQFAYDFKRPDKSWFAINLDNVDAAPLAAWTDIKIEGTVQARLRGSRSDGWHGSGDLELTRAKIQGVEVSQWRMPLTWTYSTEQGSGQLNIPETSAQVARGRVTGKMNLSYDGSAARIEGNLRLTGVDVQEFLRQTIGPSQVGGGTMTGRIDFAGNQVRSVDDLSAKVALSFQQAQALQAPVLKQLAPYLGLGATTTFQSGELAAKLERGILRIQSLTLRGNNVRVYLDGNVTLAGRLGLDVVAKTSTVGLPLSQMRLLGLRIPAVGPIPLVLVQEASNLLSNQLIYLQVTGSVQSPVVQPRALPTLAQGAVRFFLNQSGVPALDFE